MNRRAILPIVSLFIASALASAQQQTDIKTGLPAVTVNLKKNEIYTVDEYKASIARIDKTLSSRLNPEISEDERTQAHMQMMAAIKPKLLDAQISAMLFRQFCEREGVIVAEADVTNYIARFKAQLGVASQSDEAFEAALTVSQGVVLGLKTYARGRLLLTRYMQQKKPAELKALRTPGSDEIMAAYEEMKTDLVVPEIARISKVYIEYKGMDAAARKAANETMRGLAAKVKDDRSYFDKLLLESVNPDVGYSAKPSYQVANVKEESNSQVNDYLDAVFAMKPGEVSGLLDDSEELQIVRVNEITPSKLLALYDVVPGSSNNVSVQDLIVSQLIGIAQENYASKLQTEILEKLRGEAKVTIMKDNLKGVIGDSEIDTLIKRYTKK